MNYPIALGTKETKLLFSSSETLPMTIVIGTDGSVTLIGVSATTKKSYSRRSHTLTNKGRRANRGIRDYATA